MIDGTERGIVGVMPSFFEVPEADTDVWLPLIIDPETDHLANFGAGCIARLGDGVNVADTIRDLKRITERLVEEFPSEPGASLLDRAELIPRVEPILEVMVGEVS